MTSGPFDFAPLLPAGLPAPAVKWTGAPGYNFTGGNNDADHVPVDGLIAAANAVLRREGCSPRSAASNSASRRASPMSRRPRRAERAAGLETGRATLRVR